MTRSWARAGRSCLPVRKRGGSAAHARRRVGRQRDAPVGGQAVLEGVMMRGVSVWAVAVRRPTARSRSAPSRSPMGHASPALAPAGPARCGRPRRVAEDRLPRDRDLRQRSARGRRGGREPEEIGGWVWGLTIAFSLLPSSSSSSFRSGCRRPDQGQARLAPPLLAGRLVEVGAHRRSSWLPARLISRLKDLRRVFEYHGAEHKTISCYEAEDELTPARARSSTRRLHPRCGTSFLLIVMVLAIFVFAPDGMPAWYWLVVFAGSSA